MTLEAAIFPKSEVCAYGLHLAVIHLEHGVGRCQVLLRSERR